MKSTRFILRNALIALTALSIFAFTGCQSGDDEVQTSSPYSEIEQILPIDTLVGKWVNSYDGGSDTYEISAKTFKNYGSSSWSGDYESYEGDNLFVVKSSKTDGIIYLRYTKAFCAEHSDFANYVYTYDADAPDAGKWYAVAYRNLSKTSVEISGAMGSKEGHYATSSETLLSAISEFTFENGYFGTFSLCTKTK